MRISVTDRCNLRCKYCMPEEGIKKYPRENILSYEEIETIANICIKEFGIRKIRITGGEPLVRPHIENLIRLLNKIDGLEEISLTTNGVLLNSKAVTLKDAGINRINISIDTLNKEKYYSITGRDELNSVIEGINTAIEAGFSPIKLNTVVMKDINDDEIPTMIKFAISMGLEIRFIEFMNMANNKSFYISNNLIKDRLSGEFDLQETEQTSRVSREYIISQGGKSTKIGFISPLSNLFCENCNRIRITSTGEILSCLMVSEKYDLRKPLREGDMIAVKNIIEKAIINKPLYHNGKGHVPMYAAGG